MEAVECFDAAARRSPYGFATEGIRCECPGHAADVFALSDVKQCARDDMWHALFHSVNYRSSRSGVLSCSGPHCDPEHMQLAGAGRAR